jgi:CheY-like chemotaxis protein
MTILFIDDDPEDTELFCEAVAYLNRSEFINGPKEDIECIPVNDGCQAIELIPTLKRKPDYIFLDINMPLMNGRECLKYLKTNPDLATIPVIMLSTTFRPDDENEFKTLGAVDCIKKPGSFNELARLLSKYVYRNYL